MQCEEVTGRGVQGILALGDVGIAAELLVVGAAVLRDVGRAERLRDMLCSVRLARAFPAAERDALGVVPLNGVGQDIPVPKDAIAANIRGADSARRIAHLYDFVFHFWQPLREVRRVLVLAAEHHVDMPAPSLQVAVYLVEFGIGEPVLRALLICGQHADIRPVAEDLGEPTFAQAWGDGLEIRSGAQPGLIGLVVLHRNEQYVHLIGRIGDGGEMAVVRGEELAAEQADPLARVARDVGTEVHVRRPPSREAGERRRARSRWGPRVCASSASRTRS